MEIKDDKDLMGRSPNRLLTNFSKGYLLAGVIGTLVFHVLVIGGCSLGYIRDTWIDPEGAVERKAAAEAARLKAEGGAATNAPAVSTNAPAASTNAPAASTNAPAGATKPEVKAGPTAKSDDEPEIPAEHADAPMVKAITAVAKPEEMPNLEKGSGVSLDDDDKK